jgi:hypothetical protein
MRTIIGVFALARGRTKHMLKGIASCTDGGGGATIQCSCVKPATALGFLFASSMACVIAVPAQAEDRLLGNCYPRNQFTLGGTGTTFASGEAEGKVEEVELEGPDPGNKNLGGAKVELNFRAEIEGNKTFEGALDVDIKWNDLSLTGGVRETKFSTGCAQELLTESQPGKLGGFEGEFEGGLVNFPFFNGTIKAGVGSVVVKKDESNPGKIEVDFSLQTGITCYEDNGLGESGDIELAKIALTNLSPRGFNIKNFARGEWSFPVGKNPRNCAGSG